MNSLEPEDYSKEDWDTVLEVIKTFAPITSLYIYYGFTGFAKLAFGWDLWGVFFLLIVVPLILFPTAIPFFFLDVVLQPIYWVFYGLRWVLFGKVPLASETNSD